MALHSQDGKTALHYAVRGDIAIAEALISAGALVVTPDSVSPPLWHRGDLQMRPHIS